jgi:hypothetical protein
MTTPENPAPSPAAAPTPPPIPNLNHQTRRRNGKIAHLPKTVRDQLNTMLADGLTYPEIIQALGDQAADLNKDNLSNWHAGGYKD